MIIGPLRILFKRENINFRVESCSIFLMNQKSELEPCLMKFLEIATQSGQ